MHPQAPSPRSGTSLAFLAVVAAALLSPHLTLAAPHGGGGDSSSSPTALRLTTRNIVTALPRSATGVEAAVQPVLDFDTDGCYNTAAIDSSGRTNSGLDSVLKCPADDCRNTARLQNNNVYSRRRCNNGWCAVMYEYYFEKDQAICGSFLGGHRHDWENIVVFVEQATNTIKRIAPSCHGKYEHAANDGFRLDGATGRPKMVYHKDGAGTHCFRFANESDDRIENETGQWFSGALVGWDNWPSAGLRDAMLNAWSGGVGPKLDGEFVDSLRAAAGGQVPGFDPSIDA
ncbi:mosquitocidal toxin protein [Microdochium trichocladiopsis]|uniref:Mosquitocidal toxin protein n=1 Tax=Microdochium trichocladiopsis TaxID=1682393 RepID=A0A9P8YEW9_9PEZI|nr:mosquitocidal toxin protein [Microdochium trichocladiopsis]KAH7035727.1 mosquitocidal toxin protein [Microdochium trichocladiopsis]